ncbi:hypothetical protein BLEM_2194 [Bifidobacterium lemurum]|uniref:DUF6591 domain-containing protein n=1 Tax=Bifidobacterium lemurum TaxID=1603886 RepID=A0A261FLI5_9BIFI|nr:DUF6591 domain-containing protein [Bifidobacterium lemurum]OZG60019.1 hypothetical protein BLEM_2194 [Bifidobacterium lemurum]QOL34030.1 hypothetical protein BL8807_09820 [Bifidobacterium lemurum]
MTSPSDWTPQSNHPNGNDDDVKQPMDEQPIAETATTPLPSVAESNSLSDDMQDTAAERDYAVDPQHLYQAIRTQLTTGATFALDSENTQTGVFTFHSFDGFQFIASIHPHKTTGTSVRLQSTDGSGSNRFDEFFASIDAALGVASAKKQKGEDSSPNTADIVGTIFAFIAPKDEQGKKTSKLAITAIVFSALFVLAGFSGFENLGALLSMTFLSAVFCAAALYATRPTGTVGGRLLASIAVLLTILGLIIGGVGVGIDAVRNASEKTDTGDVSTQQTEPEPTQCETIIWPTAGIGSKLPAPESLSGTINVDSSDSFDVSICDVSKDQFNAYVESVKTAGFTVDYYKSDDNFSAENAEGDSLSIYYGYNDEDDVMNIDIYNFDSDDSDTSGDEQSSTTEPSQNTENNTEDQTPAEQQPSGNADFRSTMDSYEKFVDEYVAFIQKYKESGDSVSMLADYGSMMQRLNEYNQQLASFDQNSFSVDDLAYYTEVMNRCNQKIASVAQ